jgi:hypothetical protein
MLQTLKETLLPYVFCESTHSLFLARLLPRIMLELYCSPKIACTNTASRDRFGVCLHLCIGVLGLRNQSILDGVIHYGFIP